jgi:iron complex transport system substrate-binding protein
MMITHTPQRVVCLQPSATVVLDELGKLDLVVACTKHCAALVPEVLDGTRTIIADSWTAKTTEIMAALPDLVIAAVPYQEQAVIEILKAGVRFLGLAPKNIADIYKDIAAIAGIIGKAEEGEEIVADMQREIESVRAQTRTLPRVRVFCEEWGKPVIASQAWVAELVEAAGGEFVGTPGAQTTSAAVLAADPEVVIAAWCGAGDRVPLEKITREREWRNMRAVKDGRVYCICDDYLNTPAPTLRKGLRALAAAIHPACFPHVIGLRCIDESAG